jgi:AraC-like DNA-binding protein
MTTDARNMTPGFTSTVPAELTVGAGLVRGLLAFAASRGADADALAAQAGLDPAALGDQDARVPMPAYVALFHAAKAATGEPALALLYGEAVDLAELSIVGLIMNASATMGDAFLQMNRFGRLAIEVDGAGDRFTHVMDDRGVWLVDQRANPNAFPELTEVTFARMAVQPRRFLDRPHVLEAHVTHPDPGYRADYERVLQCPVAFGTQWNALRIAPDLPSWPISRRQSYVFGVLSERAGALLTELEQRRTTRGAVERLLMPILHTGEIRIDMIAGKLGVSRQTLFRRLKAEGTTFEQVLDDLRHRLALDYLAGRKTSVNETAYLVGFSEPAAFSRAFKRWTGMSPREARSGS